MKKYIILVLFIFYFSNAMEQPAQKVISGVDANKLTKEKIEDLRFLDHQEELALVPLSARTETKTLSIGGWAVALQYKPGVNF